MEKLTEKQQKELSKLIDQLVTYKIDGEFYVFRENENLTTGYYSTLLDFAEKHKLSQNYNYLSHITNDKPFRITDDLKFEHTFNKNGVLHSYNDHPSIYRFDGTKRWHENGVLHRDNDENGNLQPAAIFPKGSLVAIFSEQYQHPEFATQEIQYYYKKGKQIKIN